MLRTRWRTWLGWTVGCAILVGIGFALYATLPPEPRFVLRGSHTVAGLSPDGRILTTGTLERDQDGESRWVSLKAWDTITGRERGEFFRGLLGSREVFQVREPRGGFDLGGGVPPDSLVYSPAGRYFTFKDGDTELISCWDVPGRPSLTLVVGIPLALGCIALIVRWRWTRKRTTLPNPQVS